MSAAHVRAVGLGDFSRMQVQLLPFFTNFERVAKCEDAFTAGTQTDNWLPESKSFAGSNPAALTF